MNHKFVHSITRIATLSFGCFATLWTIIEPLDAFGLAGEVITFNPYGYFFLVIISLLFGLSTHFVIRYVTQKRYRSLNTVVVHHSLQNDVAWWEHGDLEISLESITPVALIVETPHSTVEKCTIAGRPCIVKKTRKKLCDVKALKKITKKQIREYGSAGSVSVSIVTPIMVWETSDQVYELLPYYEGVNLRELIERSGLTLEGETLGAIFNSLLEAANQLHEIGILHRDINPSNILLIEPKLRRKENGEGYSYNIFRLQLVLIDVTFCCDVNSPQVPVSNPSFTASEQKRGKAVVQSDWFSIAGTVYFLANGIPPQQWDEESYAHGLRRAASMGPYRPSPSFYAKFKTRFERNMALLETLLSENLSLRPSKLHEVMLQECTMPNFPPELHNILDIGDGKFLYFTDRSFFVGDISTLYHEFQVAKKAGKFISDEVYKVIRKSSIST